MMSLQENTAISLVSKYPLDILELIVNKAQERLSKERKKKVVIHIKPDYNYKSLLDDVIFHFDLIMAAKEEFASYSEFDMPDNAREKMLNGDEAMIRLMSNKIKRFQFPLWFTYKLSNLILEFIEQHPEYEDYFLIEKANLYQYVTFFEEFSEYGDFTLFAGYYIGSNDELFF